MTSALRKNVITGLIKANFPTKIAFRVSDGMDSRVILDAVGAEKLLGNGDMLFNPPGAGAAVLDRIQGAYVSDPEIAKVIDEVAAQHPQSFDDGIFSGDDVSVRLDNADNDEETGDVENSDIIRALADKYLQPDDPIILERALEIIINDQTVSTSYLQRKLGIGYNQAAGIIDKLEERHIISAPLPDSPKRTILIDIGK